MSNWNANVPLFVDGTSELNQATVNPVITSLAQRDQYLFEMLNDQSDKTILLSYNQPIASGTAVGTPVYWNTSGATPVLSPAQGSYTSSTGGHLIPSSTAFVFGVVEQIYEGQSGPIVYGDIYIRGLVSGIDFSALLDAQSIANGAAVPGPFYLSSSQPGKLTIFPSGASIFVGYFISTSLFVLAPNIDSLNQLYFNYRVFLRPAPAGTAVLSGTTWTITHTGSTLTNDVTNLVGWISATDAQSALSVTPPAGAYFYYNVPANSTIINTTESDTQNYYLSSEEKQNALQLKNALPAYPAAYTMVFLNGILQTEYDEDHPDGAYIINENGIWWMLNQTNYVPWDSGGPSLSGTLTNTSGGTGDATVTFSSWSSATPGTFVFNVTGVTVTPAVSQTYTNNNFTYTVTSTSITSGAGTITVTVPTVNAVNLQLLITKLNPNFADTIVTSLTSGNPAIQITGDAGQTASSGDLTVTLELPTAVVSASGNGQCIQSSSYSPETGITTLQSAPVVNTITVGPGLVLNTNPPGNAILSLSNFSLSGEVDDIEPQEAEFIYKGLNSYLKIKNPQVNQTIGFIGKLRVPSNIPANTPLSIQINCFADSPTISTSTTASFNFQYSVSNSNISITNAVTTSTVSISGAFFHPTVNGSPATLTQTTVYEDNSSNPFFTIPASAFTAGAYINFSISRTNNTYPNSLGILGISWIIE